MANRAGPLPIPNRAPRQAREIPRWSWAPDITHSVPEWEDFSWFPARTFGPTAENTNVEEVAAVFRNASEKVSKKCPSGTTQ
jgi:hypothetical protein